jgi:ATP-dependent DNA helicase DinG
VGTTLQERIGPHLPDYEPRAEQEQMADAVRRALGEGRHLVVEAGTGTGKSLAYLFPLAEFLLAEERRAVVSTYTKALQRQLVEKDLPFLKEKVFEPLRFALSLGSENYLCLRRLEQAGTHGLFTEPDEEVERLRRWALRSETGIRERTGWEMWQKVCRESDLCTGRDCRFFTRCFYQQARERERQSHVLVVNHHLYFANLASGQRVLPAFDLAVFDEAHELEDVAADYLGHEVSNFRMRHVLSRILSPQGRGILSRLRWLEASQFTHLGSLVEAARQAADLFFSELSLMLEGPTLRLRQPGSISDPLSEPLVALCREVAALRDASGDEEEKAELEAYALRLAGAAESLRVVLSHELEDHVYWAERAGKRLRLAATPVDVAGMSVFQDLESAVFTSATLATGGSFGYIRERLGLEGAEELLLNSPFDYREQALLYLPRDLPEPNSPGFEDRAVERIEELLGITRGRSLVLFTSHAMLNRAADRVEARGASILRQGEMDSYRLVEEFKRGGVEAIFGTATFWQGIDVPGEALTSVVIVRLPFAVPDEPVTQARAEKLRAQGKDPFTHYQLPQAALFLKQGFGRLIRRSTDRGVVAILDTRITTRQYGRVFLRSLPPCRVTGSLEDLSRFLGTKPAGFETAT